jgi:hypothetical protein
MKHLLRRPEAAWLGTAALVLVALADNSSSGHSSSRWDALPRIDEQLAQPIRLPHCGMPIVEWRATPELGAETTASDRALAVVDETCRSAFERYGAFLRSRDIPQSRTEPEALPAVSVLPANVALDGRTPRALNDVTSRFEAVAPAGCCYWGLYVDSLDHLFLRNDPLTIDSTGTLRPNPRFVRTLTHEISHVLSSALGVWSVVPYDRALDERLAEEFVAFMGVAAPVESSTEDLAFHRAQSVTSRIP